MVWTEGCPCRVFELSPSEIQARFGVGLLVLSSRDNENRALFGVAAGAEGGALCRQHDPVEHTRPRTFFTAISVRTRQRSACNCRAIVHSFREFKFRIVSMLCLMDVVAYVTRD